MGLQHRDAKKYGLRRLDGLKKVPYTETNEPGCPAERMKLYVEGT